MVAPENLVFNVAAAKLSPVSADAFYRSVSLTVLANLGIHPLDGAHSGVAGGRFNAPNSPPICYLAGTQTLAAFECEQNAMVVRLPTSPLEPRLTFAVTVAGAQLLDLTSRLTLHGLGIEPEELVRASSHWQHQNELGTLALTQAIGRAARDRVDVDGLLVPSWLGALLPAGLIPRTHNVVLFMDPVDPTQPRRSSVTLTMHDPTGLLR